jgi:hypothetical protein
MALIPELVELAVRHGAADSNKVAASLQDAARNQSSLMRALLDSAEIDENGFYRDLADKYHLRWGGADIAKAACAHRVALPTAACGDR